MKQLFITAYLWMFGTTKKEAEKAYRENKNNPVYIRAVIEGHTGNARKSFYAD